MLKKWYTIVRRNPIQVSKSATLLGCGLLVKSITSGRQYFALQSQTELNRKGRRKRPLLPQPLTRPLKLPHSLPPHLSPHTARYFSLNREPKLILPGHSSGKVTKTLLEMLLLSHMDLQRLARSSTVTVTSALGGDSPHRGAR